MADPAPPAVTASRVPSPSTAAQESMLADPVFASEMPSVASAPQSSSSKSRRRSAEMAVHVPPRELNMQPEFDVIHMQDVRLVFDAVTVQTRAVVVKNDEGETEAANIALAVHESSPVQVGLKSMAQLKLQIDGETYDVMFVCSITLTPTWRILAFLVE